MGDFTVDDELDSYNVTDEEIEIQRKLREECMKRINQRLQSRGINKYYFSTNAGVDLTLMRDDFNFEEINNDLDKKEHYIGINKWFEVPTLDFEEKEDETVGEYLERLEKYTDCFSKYYDGETIDESIKFDKDGNLIENPEVEKSDFEKVAKSKEAVSELQSGTVQEIRDEMNPDKTKEEVETEYGE